MAKEIIRAYNSSDDYMCETSDTLHAIFVDELAAFTAYDSTLDATFASNWLAKIDNARTVVKDSQIKDILAQKTEQVIAIMDLCRKKYNEVKYFAVKTFPNSIARQSEFGIDTYLKARNSQSRMISFLDEMHKACTSYQTELLANGMSAPQIAEILTLRDDLLEANTQQERYAKGRPVLTQERIITLNECFFDTRTVIEAAQVVYYDDFARKSQYVFGNGAGGGVSNNDVIVTGVVTNSLTSAPVGDATVVINTSLGSFPEQTNPLGEYSVTIQLAETENCPINVNAIGFQSFVQIESINPEVSPVLNFELIPD